MIAQARISQFFLTGSPHMNRSELEKRTLRFALKIIEFVSTLPKSKTGEIVEFQLVKAGTSVGANYREANRAESRNDFIHKLAIVEKESSESLYWLELCQEAGLGNASLRGWLLQESRELLAIFTSAGRTSKTNRQLIGRRQSASR
jgi:four helix bundle protein